MGFRRQIQRAAEPVKRWRNHFTRITFYEGSKVEGEAVTLVHAGWDRKLLAYWLGRMDEEELKRVRTRYMARKRFASLVSRGQISSDVGILENAAEIHFTEQTAAFLLPRWMELIIDVEHSLKGHYTKEIRRRIRKYGLSAEYRENREDLDEFYHHMYTPLMTARHRDTAEVASHDYFYRKFRAGALELLFLIREEKRVAGLVIEDQSGKKRILAFGVKDGKEEIVRWGVHAAAYYFALLHCRDQGLSQILCGSSMPVVFDGVTQFKLRLGAKPYLKDLPARKKYHLALFSRSPRVLNMLTSNPLFHLSANNLRVTAWINAERVDTPAAFERFMKLVRSENVEKMECRVFNDPEAKIAGWVNGGSVTPVELIQV